MGHPQNTVERMLKSNVEKTPTCWIWKGSFSPNGYGKTSIQKAFCSSHRVMYEHFKGKIPEGHYVTHSCKNKACVNPAHLKAVTPADCVSEGDSPSGQNSRKHACARGHALSGGNLYVTPDGRRQCKTCRAAASAKLKEKHFA